MKQIEITVRPDGKTSLETTGFSGSECQQASRFLERALGPVVDEQLTPAFHEHTETQQSHQHEQQSS